jgi:TRAP-type mannitol/chloroaromatic compound transport system permease small subunit
LIQLVKKISEKAGSLGKWFALLLVLVGAYDTIARHFFNAPTTIARHFFNAPTIWAYDTLCMAGGTLYLIGASYTYLHESHTRVDLFYNLLSPRRKALMDVICSILFFFPLMGVMLKLSIVWAIKAWRINEVMFQSFWYPPAGPYRTIFALGLFLLILQGVAKFIRDLYFVIRGEPID